MAQASDITTGIHAEDRFLTRFLPGQAMHRLREEIQTINTARNLTVLRSVMICGESGSGKNYLAKVIAGHRQWLRSQADTEDDKATKPLETYTQKFVEVSLPSLPDQLVESELFGHERGAFTGATRRHDGYFREGYSDILLDEIGDASLPLQAKLLQVLNNGQFRPLGGTRDKEQRTDARLLMATNKDLPALTRSGGFRKDLLWRARQFVLNVPPLRDQLDAVHNISHNILKELFERKPEGLGKHPTPTREDLAFARSHTWPGNIRELQHALRRWVVYDGTRSLAVIAKELSSELEALREADVGQSFGQEVFAVLDRARISGEPAADTPGELVKRFRAQVGQLVYDWLQVSRPTPPELEQMFPASKSVNSIRTQINRWRPQ